MKTMSILRGLAVIAVVLGHAIYWVDLGQMQLAGASGAGWASTHPLQSPTYHLLKMIYVLTLFDVPAFLFASGLFIAYANIGGKDIHLSNIGKWIKPLIPPFVIWVTAHTLISWFPILLFPQEGAAGLLPRLLGALNLAYYIPLVVQFYLLAPWISRLAQKHWQCLLFGAAVIQVTSSIIWYLPRLGIPVGNTIENFSRVSVFFFWAWAIYFPLGVVWGTYLNKIKPWLDRNRKSVIILAVIAAVLAIIEMETLGRFPDLLDPSQFSLTTIFYSVSFIAFFFSVSERELSCKHQLGDIGLKSLGIYLAHPLVFLTVYRVIKFTIPGMVFYSLAYLPVLFITGFGLPYALGVFLSKKSKKYIYRYLFG